MDGTESGSTDTATRLSYLLIESQGTWSGRHAAAFLGDAAALAEAGHRVRVFLVQDGVFAAVNGANAELDRLAAAGGEILVDDFSSAQRALSRATVSPKVRFADMEWVAAALAEDDCRAVWH